MNENSKPLTQPNTVGMWLDEATKRLRDESINSARLDAELILAHTLRKGRTWLHAHSDDDMSERHIDIAEARLRLRIDRVPVAYIIGHKDFYGRRFKVSPSVLVPRPESESLIELLKKYVSLDHRSLVDVGTGSGCLGITAKLELPRIRVTLSDISRHALAVAEENVKLHDVQITVIKSDLLLDYPSSPDIIIANLPYVDTEWERSPETNHEPALALFSEDNGLRLIMKLINQAKNRLSPNGLLLLEADPYQHPKIIDLCVEAGFSHLETSDYALVFRNAGPLGIQLT